MKLRSAALHLGQTVVDTPMRAPGLPQGAGHPRNVAFVAFYRGVQLFHAAQGLARPTCTDVADLSIYWHLEQEEEEPNPADKMLTPNEKRKKRINNWKARLREPWAQAVRDDVAELLRPTSIDDPDVGPDLWAGE